MPETGGAPLSVALLNFHEGWGGQAAYVLVLARGLSRAGHRVVVACPPGSELAKRAAAAGLATYEACRFRHGFRPFEFLGEVKKLGSFLRDFQIAHTHGSQDSWRVALACRFYRPGCRHVRTKHNSYKVTAHPANKWLFTRGIDRLIVVADALKPLVAGILPPGRIDILHAPVADRFFQPADGSAFRAELGIGPEVPLIGVIARLVPDKGQAHVLRALVELRKRFPDITAVFAGDGSDFDKLKALIGELGLGKNARLLGPRTDVPAITAALDVSVLPSTGCDASSTVVKEALAQGCPVVATEIGGIREIIEAGKTGLIIPPGDPAALARAIGEVLADRAGARAMAARGREVCRERFSESAFIDGQLAIYRQVLAGRSR